MVNRYELSVTQRPGRIQRDRTYRDPALTHLVRRAGEVDAVVLGAYAELQWMRRDGVDITTALIDEVYDELREIADAHGNAAAMKPFMQAYRSWQMARMTSTPSLAHVTNVVYFIEWGNRIKIGTTTDLRSRVTSLSLTPDAVIFAMPGDRHVERDIHGRLGQWRIANTEWFHATPEVYAFIEGQRKQQE